MREGAVDAMVYIVLAVASTVASLASGAVAVLVVVFPRSVCVLFGQSHSNSEFCAFALIESTTNTA